MQVGKITPYAGCQHVKISDVLQVFNTVIGKMVTAVLWTSPLGIASLIAAAICRACSLLGTLSALGLWLTTVVAGLSSAPSGSTASTEFSPAS